MPGKTQETPFGISRDEWAARDAALLDHRAERIARHQAIAVNARDKAQLFKPDRIPHHFTVRRSQGPFRIGGPYWAEEVARLERLADWHECRATTLAEPWAERVEGCGQRSHVSAWCSTCGTVHTIPVGCGQGHWCEVCSNRRRSRVRKRVLPAIAAAERRELARWSRSTRGRGTRPGVRLITLTVRHSGDATRDRDTITKGWARLRAWMHHRIGARPYVLTWEVTDGDDSAHVHAHAVVVWPWVDVQDLAAAWVDATKGAADPQGFDMKSSTSADASRYAAKYATKGCDPRSVSRDTWVAWVKASASRRSYTTSRGLLADVEPSRPPCCEDDGEWGAAELRKGPPPRLDSSPVAAHDVETVA